MRVKNENIQKGQRVFNNKSLKMPTVYIYIIRADNIVLQLYTGFSGVSSGKEPICHCRSCKRCGFDPWIGKIPCRRAWQSTPVFLPGESHGQGSLVGYSPWGCQEPDMTKRLSMHTLIKRKNLNSNSGLCRWQEKKTKLFVKEKNSLLVPMLPSKENGS